MYIYIHTYLHTCIYSWIKALTCHYSTLLTIPSMWKVVALEITWGKQRGRTTVEAGKRISYRIVSLKCERW